MGDYVIYNKHYVSGKIRKTIFCRGVCSSWISWKYLRKSSTTFGVRTTTGEVLANFSFQLLSKWLFMFFITCYKTISFEIIAGVLSRKMSLVSGIFHILVRITSYKKDLHWRFFSLWQQITLTHLNDSQVFLCSPTFTTHGNCALRFAEIVRIQPSPNTQQSAGKQGKATKQKAWAERTIIKQ